MEERPPRNNIRHYASTNPTTYIYASNKPWPSEFQRPVDQEKEDLTEAGSFPILLFFPSPRFITRPEKKKTTPLSKTENWVRLYGGT